MVAEDPPLIPRKYDVHARLQMAEGRLDRHSEHGTPTENLFVVHHYDQPDTARDGGVELQGLDGREHKLTNQELKSIGSQEQVAVLECAGNARGLRRHRTPGTQFGCGLFGQARWTGVRLADLLDHCGLEGPWRTAVIHAPDAGWVQPEDTYASFAKGLPREKALEPDTLLAWGLDDMPLPDAHGGPLRLVVPGWYGIWWVKWVRRIELTAEDFQGFWQRERYTYQDDNGCVRAVVSEQLPRAVILSPLEGQRIRGDHMVRGLAWAGEHALSAVEVSVDDGATWRPAEITEQVAHWGWARWEAPLQGLPCGVWRVAARATDAGGRTQSWEPEFNRLGYANNGIHILAAEVVPASKP